MVIQQIALNFQISTFLLTDKFKMKYTYNMASWFYGRFNGVTSPLLILLLPRDYCY